MIFELIVSASAVKARRGATIRTRMRRFGNQISGLDCTLSGLRIGALRYDKRGREICCELAEEKELQPWNFRGEEIVGSQCHSSRAAVESTVCERGSWGERNGKIDGKCEIVCFASTAFVQRENEHGDVLPSAGRAQARRLARAEREQRFRRGEAAAPRGGARGGRRGRGGGGGGSDAIDEQHRPDERSRDARTKTHRRPSLSRGAVAPRHHSLLFHLVLPLHDRPHRTPLPPRVLQLQKSLKSTGHLQGLPRLYGQHVPPQPLRVSHRHRLPTEPRRRRLRHYAGSRFPRTMGNHQLPGPSSHSSHCTMLTRRAQIDADTRPSALVPPFTGHFRILVDTPRGLAPLHPGTKVLPTNTSATEMRRDVVQTDPLRPAKPDTRLQSADSAATLATSFLAQPRMIEVKPCSTCGTSTSPTRYSAIKTRGEFSVCATCYSEGRFPSTMHSGDFVKLEEGPFRHPEGNKWEDQEVLLLLEGLEMYEEDWDKIADHVGTRTKEQCILHFLQLPIEDPYLETTQKELGPLQYARLPFSDAENPVLSVMAFLAGAVDKDVAAKAAGEAVEAIEAGLKRRANGIEEAEPQEMQVENGTAEETKSTQTTLQKSALVALGSAAAKAHVMALEEDATLHSLVGSVVEAQVKKLELKLSHFTSLESLLEVERRSLEQARQELYEDRLKVTRVMHEINALHVRAKESQQAAASITNAELQAMMQGAASLNPPRGAAVQPPPPRPTGQYSSMI